MKRELRYDGPTASSALIVITTAQALSRTSSRNRCSSYQAAVCCVIRDKKG